MNDQGNRRRHLTLALTALAVTSAAALPVGSGPEPNPDRVEVPFELLPSNHMIVEVSINEEGPYHLIFDVGAPVTLLSNRAAREAKLFGDHPPIGFLFGARGEAEVDQLQVGNLTAKDVPVMVMDHPIVKALGDILEKPLDGLVGHTFFARYKTTIDYQAKTMAFEPVDHEVRDFLADLPERFSGPKRARNIGLEPAALFGVRLEDTAADGDEGVTIAEVFERSPAAEADLKPGDVVTTLDGRWTTSEVDFFDAASRIAPGATVELVLRRDGEESTVEITPRAGL